MPCDNAGHVHVWPATGTLFIERCEHYCQLCPGELAQKEWKFPWFLRRHVRAVHIESGEYPNLTVDDSWDSKNPKGCKAAEKATPEPKKKRRGKPNAITTEQPGIAAQYPVKFEHSQYMSMNLGADESMMQPHPYPYNTLPQIMVGEVTPMMGFEEPNVPTSVALAAAPTGATYDTQFFPSQAFTVDLTNQSNDESNFPFTIPTGTGLAHSIFSTNNGAETIASGAGSYDDDDSSFSNVHGGADIGFHDMLDGYGAPDMTDINDMMLDDIDETIEAAFPTDVDPAKLAIPNDSAIKDVSDPTLQEILSMKAKPANPELANTLTEIIAATCDSLGAHGLHRNEMLYTLEEYIMQLGQAMGR